jgi:hypothetical protein
MGRQVHKKERREEQYPAERWAQYPAERRASLEILIEILHIEKVPRHRQYQAHQETEAQVFWMEVNLEMS